MVKVVVVLVGAWLIGCALGTLYLAFVNRFPRD